MKRILILHDTDGRPYFQAIQRLCASRGRRLEFRELTVLRWLMGKLKRGVLTTSMLRRLLDNLVLRVVVPWVSGWHIVVGIAPFNFRLVWYSMLSRRNKFVYHTSWHDWRLDRAPWEYGILTPLLAQFWRRFLSTHRQLTIVCVTRQTERSLRTFLSDSGASLPRIVVIPHSVDVELFRPKALPGLSDPLRLLFVGRLTPEKGLDVLFEVARALQEYFPISFTIVGDGPLLDVAKTRASAIHSIELKGRIDDKVELAKLYREHDFLLLPSIRVGPWEEFFGIVVIEAMASGLIAIASDHVGPREIISNGINGYLVQEKDPAAIVKLVREIRAKPDLALSLSSAARAEALKYSVSAVASEWEAVLQ